jgi:glycine/D-amino acid oxidase-like deaminating enzyme
MDRFPPLFDRENMKSFNGIFAVTPDALPLAGEIESIKGLWVAAAIWITQAGGVARLVAEMIEGKDVDNTVKEALDPNRFSGTDQAALKEKALGTYNNIWNSEK